MHLYRKIADTIRQCPIDNSNHYTQDPCTNCPYNSKTHCWKALQKEAGEAIELLLKENEQLRQRQYKGRHEKHGIST